MKSNRCNYKWLGQVEFGKARNIEEQLVYEVAAKEKNHSILFLEHPPTYTLGRSGNPSHLLITEDRLKEMGAVLYRTDRGGDITFHGPGQLVGYPVLDLKQLGLGIRTYVRGIEEVLIKAISAFGVKAERISGFPGVWIGDGKIAAVGVRLNRNKITSHGFALNVNNDLSYFSGIIPCGIKNKGVTSLAEITKKTNRLSDVLMQVVSAFGEVFGINMELQYERNIIN